MENAPSLENLRPALAGLIVDNEIGRKEAYATFINLVERGHISSAKKKEGLIFYSGMKGANGLYPFELRIMAILGKEKTDEDEIRKCLDRISDKPDFSDEATQVAVEQGLYLSLIHI